MGPSDTNRSEVGEGAFLLLNETEPIRAFTRQAVGRREDFFALRDTGGCKLVHRQLTAESLVKIDQGALNLMGAAARSLSASAESSEGKRLHELAALSGGLLFASQRFSQLRKIALGVGKYKETVLTVCGEKEEAALVAQCLRSQGFQHVKVRVVKSARSGFLRERVRAFIVSSSVLVTLASMLLELRKTTRIRDSKKGGILFQATARLAPYIDAGLARIEQYPPINFYSERRKVGVNKLVERFPAFSCAYVDHLLFTPHVLMRWLWHLIKVRRIGLEEQAIDYIVTLPGLSASHEEKALLARLLTKGFRWRLAQSYCMARLFDRFRPAVIVNQADNVPFERIALFHARNRRIPDCCIQHGAFSEPMNLDGADAQVYFVWGESGREYLERYRKPAPQIEIVGQPDFLLMAKRAKSRKRQNNGVDVLYATRANSTESATYYGDREQDFFAMIRAAWPQNVVWSLTVKPHPRAYPVSWYQRMSRNFAEETGNEVRVSSSDLNEEIERHDLVISTGGTTVLDAVINMRTCIYIQPPGRNDIMQWKKFGCLHVVDYGDDEHLKSLLGRVENTLFNFEEESVQADRDRMLSHFFSYPAGEPAEHIFRRIWERVNAKGDGGFWRRG